jgi:hypothetical protein
MRRSDLSVSDRKLDFWRVCEVGQSREEFSLNENGAQISPAFVKSQDY